MSTAEGDHLADRLARITREADALVRQATLSEDGDAVVPVAQLTRLRRELRREPEPQPLYWMSVT